VSGTRLTLHHHAGDTLPQFFFSYVCQMGWLGNACFAEEYYYLVAAIVTGQKEK